MIVKTESVIVDINPVYLKKFAFVKEPAVFTKGAQFVYSRLDWKALATECVVTHNNFVDYYARTRSTLQTAIDQKK